MRDVLVLVLVGDVVTLAVVAYLVLRAPHRREDAWFFDDVDTPDTPGCSSLSASSRTSASENDLGTEEDESVGPSC